MVQACTFINTSVLEESLHFYQTVLGLEVVYEVHGL